MKASGERSGKWVGAAGTPNAKRARARRLIPNLGPCERCGGAATERHHKDRDINNNTKGNIAQLCRPCHIAIHDEMRSPCAECHRKLKPLRRGLCHACYERNRKRRDKEQQKDAL